MSSKRFTKVLFLVFILLSATAIYLSICNNKLEKVYHQQLDEILKIDEKIESTNSATINNKKELSTIENEKLLLIEEYRKWEKWNEEILSYLE
ncbi:MAG: hypothetical protein Q4G04_02150 [bacterium]|nr:hypothetical protein [bacterium]